MNKKIIAILIGLIMFLNPILVLAATENFTTYTEEDPNTHITVTASRVTVTGLLRNENAYVYKDKTASYFDGDFEHLITAYMTAGTSGGQNVIWGLANFIGSYSDTTKPDMLSVLIYHAGGTTYRLILQESMLGTKWSATYDISLDTPYYLKIKRDESVGTYGTIYSYIYSDSARTNLLQTLTLTLHEKEDFRYIYAGQSMNTAQAFSISGYSENLDLQEAVEKRITPTQFIE